MNKLKSIAALAADWLPDALMIAGAGAVSFGAGRVYEPAGFIVAGVFLLVTGWYLSRGSK
jgi:hypothetical protein